MLSSRRPAISCPWIQQGQWMTLLSEMTFGVAHGLFFEFWIIWRCGRDVVRASVRFRTWPSRSGWRWGGSRQSLSSRGRVSVQTSGVTRNHLRLRHHTTVHGSQHAHQGDQERYGPIVYVKKVNFFRFLCWLLSFSCIQSSLNESSFLGLIVAVKKVSDKPTSTMAAFPFFECLWVRKNCDLLYWRAEATISVIGKIWAIA